MRQASLEKKETRILIADDSRVARAMIGKVLNGTMPNVVIAGYADDGDSTLSAMDVCNPDIVILDLAMPKMDGLTVLPLILKKRPGTRIIICSSFSLPGAEISVKALFLGAAVCVAKPKGTKNPEALAEFKTLLQQAILGLCETPVVTGSGGGLIANSPSLDNFRPKAVGIASSTGGPTALMELLKATGPMSVPAFITQHVMENFTSPLARQLSQETGLDCIEAQEGMEVEPSRVYIAPGGMHMRVKKSETGVTIRLDNGPLENFCRPSADVMFRSLSEAYSGSTLAVVLTGMGKDGLSGCKEIFKMGGRVIAQDRETSSVWGMPGSVVNAGLASAALPIPGIAKYLQKMTGSAS